MAQTLTYESVFRAGVAVGVAVITDFHAQSKREDTTAANTVSVSRHSHKLAPLSGLFADDPMWPEYLQAIKKIRRQERDER